MGKFELTAWMKGGISGFLLGLVITIIEYNQAMGSLANISLVSIFPNYLEIILSVVGMVVGYLWEKYK